MMKIDHGGMAVKSLADAVKVYEHARGMTPAGCDEVEEQRVRVANWGLTARCPMSVLAGQTVNASRYSPWTVRNRSDTSPTVA